MAMVSPAPVILGKFWVARSRPISLSCALQGEAVIIWRDSSGSTENVGTGFAGICLLAVVASSVLPNRTSTIDGLLGGREVLRCSEGFNQEHQLDGNAKT